MKTIKTIILYGAYAVFVANIIGVYLEIILFFYDPVSIHVPLTAFFLGMAVWMAHVIHRNS